MVKGKGKGPSKVNLDSVDQGLYLGKSWWIRNHDFVYFTLEADLVLL